MRLRIAFMLLGVALGPSGSAQQPAEPARPPRPPGSGRSQTPKPPGLGLDASEIHIKAETQGGDPAHYQFRGFVDLTAGAVRIQADKLDLYTTDKPDGTKARRVIAEENVVFMKGEERLAGDRMDMDLDTGKGTFDNAVGYVEPGVFVEGKRIERVDERTYHVESGKFTSCAQPNPRWEIAASSAKIEVDDKIILKNALFKVKAVPAFYLPIMYYPIDRDQRSTGLLFPHFGHSSTRGYNLGEAFFWVMGRSADQTFYGDWYSKFGHGLGHELRYALPALSRGTFRTYLFWPQQGELDYDLDYNAIQALPGRFRAGLQVRRYSNLAFNQQFNDSFNRATVRNRRASLNLQRAFGPTSVQLLADSFDTFFGQSSQGQDKFHVNRRLPSLQLRQAPRKIAHTGLVFDYDTRAERLTLGDQNLVQSYSRLDVAPSLSRPLTVSFLAVNPRFGYRFTRYSATDAGDGTFEGPALDRKFFESNLELRGPTFSRVFNRPGGLYTEKIKHLIGPELAFTYRTRVDDFLAIPKFDGNDYLLGTNQVTYSLVQRLLAKRPGPGGKLVPYEFFNWRLYQSYYVQIANNQNSFDPNYSTSSFGPGGTPDHNSPVVSRVRLRPTAALSLDINHEYDVNFGQLRTSGYALRVAEERVAFQATWSRSNKLAVDPAKRARLRDTVRGATRLEVLKKQLVLEGSADYDFVKDILYQAHAKLQYNVQCCGFSAEMIQFQFNARDERQFRFSVTLAGVGDIGNFLGHDDRAGRPGGIDPYR